MCCGSRNVPAHDTQDCGVNKNANALGHDARAAHREDVVPNPCHGRDMLQNRRTGTGTATSRGCGRTTRPKACGELHLGRRDANAPCRERANFLFSPFSCTPKTRLDVPRRSSRTDRSGTRQRGGPQIISTFSSSISQLTTTSSSPSFGILPSPFKPHAPGVVKHASMSTSRRATRRASWAPEVVVEVALVGLVR